VLFDKSPLYKDIQMRLRLALCGVVLGLCVVPMLSAQDAAKVDPKHYTVLSENDQVRILKVHYGPHEKSVMHSHPAAVAVFLNNATGQFNYPGGKTEKFVSKAGDSRYTPTTVHLPENTGDEAMDVIVVELKGKAAKTEMK
jgi:quercetin dioxygenase-like cupin family protein